MSTDPKPLDLSDLSGQSLAPAWVSEVANPGSPPAKDYTEFEERPGRGGDRAGRRDGRGGGGGRDDRRGGGGRGRGDDNRGGRGGGQRRDDNRGGGPGRGGQDRRDGRGGGRDGGKGGRGRDNRRGDSRFGDGDRGPRPEEKPPEGIAVDVQPVPTGLESLAAWIRSSGRATSIFELAKAMMRRRELYQLRFHRTSESAPKLVKCTADNTLWTTREAAVGHWIQAGAPGDFYAAEKVEIDPPKGNFTAIAICGMSGTLLGPPNHHTYQTNLHRLHRERFSNFPIDRYKSRVNIEHGEEIVEKWRAQNSSATHYRWLKDPALTEPESAESSEAEASETENLEEAGAAPLPDAPEPADETETGTAENPTPDPENAGPEAGDAESESGKSEIEDVPEVADSAEADAPDSEPSDTTESESEGEAQDESKAEPEPEPEPPSSKPAGLLLESIDDLRRHALTHHGEELFAEVESATVSGNISGRDIAGPLLNALKAALEPIRRSPSALVPGLCRELEKRGLKVFRWGRALYANSTRPRPLAEDANLSDNISKIISVVREHPGIRTKRLLHILQEKPTDVPGEDRSSDPGGTTPTPDNPTTSERPIPISDAKDLPKVSEDSQPPPSPETEPPAAKSETPHAEPASPAQPPSEKPKRKPEPRPQTPEEHAAEVAILRDLRWLVHEGYLIEFTEGKIYLATARPPAHPAKKKPAQKRKRPPRQRKPRADEGAKPAKKPTEKPPVDPDAPTQKLIRDTEAPANETERVAIAQPPDPGKKNVSPPGSEIAETPPSPAPSKEPPSNLDEPSAPPDPAPEPASTATPHLGKTVSNSHPTLPPLPVEEEAPTKLENAPEAKATDPEPKPDSPET